MIRGIKRNFSGGEVAPTIPSRDDLAKYATSCLWMQNFIAQLHGGARLRPGFQFIAELLGSAVMIPFEFNTDEEDMYQLVFTDLKLRFIQDDGYVESGGSPYEVTSPYAEADLSGVRYAQMGDVMYLVHPSYAPYKLVRTGHTSWSLTAVSFTSTIGAPTGISVTWSGQASGTYTTNYVITAVDAAGEESVASAVAGNDFTYPSGEWIAGDKITLSWSAVTGADEYNIYKETNGYYGFVGVSTTTSFIDTNFEGDIGDTPPFANNPFAGGNNPSAVSFHQQRLWFAGTADNPATFYASQTANFENFNKSQPIKDDDSLEFTLASGQINQIKWMSPFGDLLVGTAGAEFKVTGTGDSAITPVSVDANPQAFNGSKNLPPIIVGNSVLHVQRQGSTIRDLFYSLEKDGYAGNNLSVLADHLFDGYEIVSWAYQQEPDSVVWAVRNDGVLLGMTFLKEHEIWGWHRHVTDGSFKDVSVVGGDREDRLYVVVEREVNSATKYYVEKLAPKWHASGGIEGAFYVDSGLTYDGAAATTIAGLDHLEGRDVVALADGSPVSGLTVSSGSITLPAAAEKVHVGLSYTGVLAPLPFEADLKIGTSQGMPKGFGQIYLRLHESVGGKVGAHGSADTIDDITFDRLQFSPTQWGQPIQPYTGVKQVTAPGGFDAELAVYVVQDQPLPFNILSLIAEVEVG